MVPDDETDIGHLELIVELIDHIERRLSKISEAVFEADKDEIDLTAYRLQTIGETTNKLTASLKGRHPEINWPAIYAMRNIIAHQYRSLRARNVWNVAMNSLAPLAAVCRAELNRLAP